VSLQRSRFPSLSARLALGILLIAGVAALGGCSLLDDPKPKSDFQLRRWGVDDTGAAALAAEMLSPSQWSQLTIIKDEEFDTSSGMELLKKSHVFVTTQADVAVQEVALTRAMQTRVFAGDVTKGVVALAELYGAMQSGGVGAVIPAVQAVMASMSKPDQETTGAALQSLVENPDLTTAEKEKKIRAYLALHGDH